MSEIIPQEVDVVIVGTGASGMAAAITAKYHGLDVLLIEKSNRFGGTTARSGGWLWVPGTEIAKKMGHEDSPEAVKRYIQYEAGEHYNEDRVDAFVESGPGAIDFFVRNTEVKFDMPLTFPDYHSEAPGGMQGGRSMVIRDYDARMLGKNIKQLEPVLPEQTVFGMVIGSGKDIKHLMRATRSPESAVYSVKRLGKHFLETLRYGRGMTLTNGNALAARLAKTVMDLQIPMWLGAPVKELLRDEGTVQGVVVEKDGKQVVVRARQGVVLAAGGFPHDIERRKELYGHAPTGKEHWSPAPETNTGDGLAMAEVNGGRVSDTLSNSAAWAPVSLTRRKDGSQGIMPHFIDRAKPGVIAVTRDGRRFVNEANSYHDYVQAMVAVCKDQEVCSWIICDHRTLRRYGLGSVPPFPLRISRFLKSGYLIKGRSLEELAKATGVDVGGLSQTVETFNESARLGLDPQFGRGSKAYNRYQGDAYHVPNPCVAPIEKGPFYAIKILPGSIGTYAGIVVDRDSRVLGEDDKPIQGLYAVGNDAVSIMGGNYPGAGITLGPGLVFGYRVGKLLATRKQAPETGKEAPQEKAIST